MAVHHPPADCAPAILRFWFDEVGNERWFAKSSELDAEIRRRFGRLHAAVLSSRAEAWRDTPEFLLAAIILFDQYSRNLHRSSAKAFAGDATALELTMIALDRGWDKAMTPPQRQFLLMPLMHSEAIATQERALIEFEGLGDDNALNFARLHHAQIARFDRFPGRNAALGRRTTEQEQAALDSGAAF